MAAPSTLAHQEGEKSTLNKLFRSCLPSAVDGDSLAYVTVCHPKKPRRSQMIVFPCFSMFVLMDCRICCHRCQIRQLAGVQRLDKAWEMVGAFGRTTGQTMGRGRPKWIVFEQRVNCSHTRWCQPFWKVWAVQPTVAGLCIHGRY